MKAVKQVIVSSPGVGVDRGLIMEGGTLYRSTIIQQSVLCWFAASAFQMSKRPVQSNPVITMSVYATPRLWRWNSIVPINSSLLTITLHSSVITTVV
jgi:hypothetical protein